MRLIIGIPLLLLLLAFALSNTQPVRLGLWPMDWQVEVPLSVAILAGMGVAFFSGGLVVWLTTLGQRRRLREAEHVARLLEAQMMGLRRGDPPIGPAG